jgi:hypothetical protein
MNISVRLVARLAFSAVQIAGFGRNRVKSGGLRIMGKIWGRIPRGPAFAPTTSSFNFAYYLKATVHALGHARGLSHLDPDASVNLDNLLSAIDSTLQAPVCGST